jgi:hypothetical protein
MLPCDGWDDLEVLLWSRSPNALSTFLLIYVIGLVVCSVTLWGLGVDIL